MKSSFAQAVGVGSADLSKQATSEYESPQPLDFVLILDRTGSMKGPTDRNGNPTTFPTPLDDVKDATLAVLNYLNPKNESIAIGTLGPSYSNKSCDGVAGAYGKYSMNDDGTAAEHHLDDRAVPVEGPVQRLPELGRDAEHRQPGGQDGEVPRVRQHDRPRDPVAAATSYLKSNGRPGAKQGIILMTDGAANMPGSTPCQAAENSAAAARAKGIQVLTIGFLSGSTKCTSQYEKSGKYVNADVTKLLAAMASPIKGVPAVDNSNNCTSNVENTDGDNFFCQPKGGDIKSVFLAAVAQLAGRLPRIIK